MRLLPLTWLLFVALLAGCAPSFLVTPVNNTQDIEELTVREAGLFAPKIAIVEVEGVLLNARSGGVLQPQENRVSLFTQQLDAAARDPSVKAVVLRINSPGGAVTASDIMYQQVVRFRKTTGKPVVAAAQDVCASGAYYVACGADELIVHPTSIVGSIGVIYQTFNVERTLDMVGVRAEAIKSGPRKDMASPLRPLTPGERQIIQSMIDEYFARFRTIVLAAHPVESPEVIEQATDGRVFTGEQAVQWKLADRSGTLEDAIDRAAQLAKIDQPRVVLYRRPFGYGGSIYAASDTPPASAQSIQVNLPGIDNRLGPGFYYLWEGR